MILPMKKVSLVVQLSAKEKALDALGKASVFHTGRLEGHGEKLNDLYIEQAHLMHSISCLPTNVKMNKTTQVSSVDLAVKITKTSEALKQAEERIVAAQKELSRVAHWGAFSPVDIERLGSDGLFINLYEIKKRDFKQFNQSPAALYIVGDAKGQLLVAAVSTAMDEMPDAPLFELPKHSIYELRSMIEVATTERKKFVDDLSILARDAVCIKERLTQLKNDIDFENTLSAMTDHEELALLEGYVPVKDLASFKALAATEGWAAIYTDPTDQQQEEETPTLTRQYGLGRFVSPVLKMLDLTPGYKEFDITSVMFFFFSIFFAMIIGDGGYGAIFFVGGIGFTLFKLFSGKGVSAGNIYFVWLSFCTIVWGAITGTWFGMEHFKEVPFLAQFIRPELDDPLFVQKMTFIIGVIHLSIGHLWAAGRHLKTNPLAAFADLGNLAMVIGLYYLVLMLLLGNTAVVAKELPGGQIPAWVVPTIGYGLLVVLLFNRQERGSNPIKAALMGLANFFPTFLSSIGNFSDIISYIRLYAVGLAGLAISQSFNTMAFGMSSPVATFAILFAAHAMNIALCMLSIVVHGLRLNSLEFSNHLGLQWSGSPYQPFASKKRYLN